MTSNWDESEATANDEMVQPRPTGMSLRDILSTDFPEIRFVVPRLLPEGLAILASRPKVGKSWLALQLGLAVSNGEKALGEFWCEPGDVLYLALEDNLRRMKERLLKLNATSNDRMTIETAWPRAHLGGQKKIEDWLRSRRNPARLIIIDTFVRYKAPTDSRKTQYEVSTDELAPLHALAHKEGLSVLLVLHQRKAEATDWIDSINGSVGSSATADTIFVLERDRGKAQAIFRSTGRDVGELELPLYFDAETGNWSLADFDPSQLGATARQSPILEVLRLFPNGLPLAQIADSLKQSPQAVKSKLDRMRDKGMIEQAGRGAVYRLRSPELF